MWKSAEIRRRFGRHGRGNGKGRVSLKGMADSSGKQTVIQEARKREIDDRIFKYVGVAGVDKPRIVQVGVGAENLANCK